MVFDVAFSFHRGASNESGEVLRRRRDLPNPLNVNALRYVARYAIIPIGFPLEAIIFPLRPL